MENINLKWQSYVFFDKRHRLRNIYNQTFQDIVTGINGYCTFKWLIAGLNYIQSNFKNILNDQMKLTGRFSSARQRESEREREREREREYSGTYMYICNKLCTWSCPRPMTTIAVAWPASLVIGFGKAHFAQEYIRWKFPYTYSVLKRHMGIPYPWLVVKGDIVRWSFGKTAKARSLVIIDRCGTYTR